MNEFDTPAAEYIYKYLNTQHISIRKTYLLYSIYDGVTHRVAMSKVGIETVGSAGQDGFTYQVLV